MSQEPSVDSHYGNIFLRSGEKELVVNNSAHMWDDGTPKEINILVGQMWNWNELRFCCVLTTGVTSTFLIDSIKIRRTLFENSPRVAWRICTHTGSVESFQWERIKLLFCLEKTGLERLFHPNKTEVSFGNTDDRKRVEGFFCNRAVWETNHFHPMVAARLVADSEGLWQ